MIRKFLHQKQQCIDFISLFTLQDSEQICTQDKFMTFASVHGILYCINLDPRLCTESVTQGQQRVHDVSTMGSTE